MCIVLRVGLLFANLTETKVIWEEGTSVEKMLPSLGPVGGPAIID